MTDTCGNLSLLSGGSHTTTLWLYSLSSYFNPSLFSRRARGLEGSPPVHAWHFDIADFVSTPAPQWLLLKFLCRILTASCFQRHMPETTLEEKNVPAKIGTLNSTPIRFQDVPFRPSGCGGYIEVIPYLGCLFHPIYSVACCRGTRARCRESCFCPALLVCDGEDLGGDCTRSDCCVSAMFSSS